MTQGSDFLTIPSFTIKGGYVHVVERDDYTRFSLHNEPVKALDLANLLFKDYEILHVVDLDASSGKDPDHGFLQKTTQSGHVWVDVGMRDAEEIIDVFMAGASEVVLPSRSLKDMYELVNAYEMSEALLFQIDYDDGVRACHDKISDMGLDGLIKEVRDIGIDRFVIADYSRMEKNCGPDMKFLSDLVKKHPKAEFFAGVGVGPEHLNELEARGLKGAMLDLRSIIRG